MSRRRTIRQELLLPFTLLVAVAVVLAVAGTVALLPHMQSPGQALIFLVLLVAIDLAVIVGFESHMVNRRLVRPVEQIVEDVARIAGGDVRHRLTEEGSRELVSIQRGVNAMADRLIRDQERLAANVESLDRTNRELVEARNQVIRSARMASVGTLAAGIAHEVGNPLGAIFAYLDVARTRLERQGADPEILDSVREEARRIDRIVRSLLDYARPGRDEPTVVDPARVLFGVRGLLEAQGRLEQVDHRWEVEPGVVHILAVPQQLEQVMVNLLLNAAHALEDTPEPRITVSLAAEAGDIARLPRRREGDPPGVDYTHRRRVSRDAEGWDVDLFTAREVAVIRVADNGSGFPQEARGDLFDPFFTTKEPGKGTGLGLSICARLVEGMGGRIDAHPGEAGGAEFVIRLPAAPPGLAAPPTTPAGESR